MATTTADLITQENEFTVSRIAAQSGFVEFYVIPDSASYELTVLYTRYIAIGLARTTKNT